ncbi:hypothetical protein [Gynurincola endophyticus]|uniref:hypothetical protein n=1 Tax=Gynurincola endophyticus TaxID=2479004 RepID=UPI000F8D9C41|nr:hypothetical protein [Gynurincola endophyticus]
MKSIQIVTLFFIVFMLASCTSSVHITGRYSNSFTAVGGELFDFNKEFKKFEYYWKAEGIRAYSSGVWTQNEKTIFLNGFNEKNINLLNVESRVEDYTDQNRDEITVNYKKDLHDIFTKVDILIDRNTTVRISGDTTFEADNVKTIRFKSYLSHEGLLLGTPPYIDTLYSPEIEINQIGESKNVSFKFDVSQSDFYRVQLTDTIIVKNSREFIWRKKVFRKIKD